MSRHERAPKRAHEKSQFDDEPYVYDQIRTTGASLPKIDEDFNKRLKYLDRKNELDDPKPQTLPLHKMPARAREGFFRVVDEWAQLNQARIVRPEDPSDVASLRRIEQQHQSERGTASGLSLLKTISTNPFYASQTPPGWKEHGKAHMLASLWSTSTTVQHKHDTSETFLLDIRVTNETGDLMALPSRAARSREDFKTSLLCNRDQVALQHGSKSRTFCTLIDTLERQLDDNSRHKLSEMLDMTTRSSGLSPYAIFFRHNSVVEIVLHIDDDARFFGLIAFSFADPNERTPSVCQRVTDELARVRKEDLDRILEPQVTLNTHLEATFGREKMEEQLEDMRKITAVSYRSYVGLKKDEATAVQRLISRVMPLCVIEPRRSKALCDLEVCYEYGYMASCQCLIEDDDLALFKRAYGRYSRHTRTNAIPQYDSDEETLLSGGASHATSSTSTTTAANSDASRYLSTRDQASNTGDLGLINNSNVISSVPFTTRTAVDKNE